MARAVRTTPRSFAVAPTASAAGMPSTTTSTTGGAVIVIVTARAIPPASATTAAAPRRRGVRLPAGVTPATAGFRDDHVTGACTCAPRRSTALADSVARVPDRTSVGTSISIVATTAGTTVTSTVARAGPEVTMTVVVPAACAVTTPAASTVATAVLDDSQRSRAPSTRDPVSVRGVASSTTHSPTSSGSAGAATRIVATPRRSVFGPLDGGCDGADGATAAGMGPRGVLTIAAR